jgi:hypothetical protein
MAATKAAASARRGSAPRSFYAAAWPGPLDIGFLFDEFVDNRVAVIPCPSAWRIRFADSRQASERSESRNLMESWCCECAQDSIGISRSVRHQISHPVKSTGFEMTNRGDCVLKLPAARLHREYTAACCHSERAKRVEESDGELYLRMRTGFNWAYHGLCAARFLIP